jgi:hypothetical protein
MHNPPREKHGIEVIEKWKLNMDHKGVYLKVLYILSELNTQ